MSPKQFKICPRLRTGNYLTKNSGQISDECRTNISALVWNLFCNIPAISPASSYFYFELVNRTNFGHARIKSGGQKPECEPNRFGQIGDILQISKLANAFQTGMPPNA